MLVNPHPTRLVWLMLRLQPSVRALVSSSVSATSRAGHHVSTRARQARRLLHLSSRFRAVEVVHAAADLVGFGRGQQQPQTFLHSVRGVDLIGRVLRGQGGVKPGPLPHGEVFVAGQQQAPGGPHPVGGDTEAGRGAPERPAASPGSPSGSRATSHSSTAIRAPGSAARIPDADGADGSMTPSSIPARNAGVCSASHWLTHAPKRCGRPVTSFRGPAGKVSEAILRACRVDHVLSGEQDE